MNTRSRHSVLTDRTQRSAMAFGSRRPERCASLGNTETTHPPIEAGAVTVVAVMNEKPWRLVVPTAAFDDLLCRPLPSRMLRHPHVEHLPAGVMDHEEDVECPKEDRLDSEKSHAQTVAACCFRNNGQPRDGLARVGRWMYLATVLADTLNPSLANSAWLLRCPHNRFSAAMRRISACSSWPTGW
jgi:hypothetical protein